VKAVFLCAGYGTRLYPLTKDRPKALLDIAGEPLLNHLLKKLELIAEIDHIILVTNERFYEPFVAWRKSVQSSKSITIVNDHTTTNANRLGAIRDLKLGLDQGKVDDDVLVLASDNLFEADLVPFVSFTKEKKAPSAVGVYDVKDRALATKYGLIEANANGKVTQFYEKPKEPRTTLASMGIYYLSQGSLPLIDQYLKSNQNPDAPGFYIGWLSGQTDLFAYPFNGRWFDIGDIQSYEKADAFFKTA
jgi:glucose-1-phosphate thymidylyltransferase